MLFAAAIFSHEVNSSTTFQTLESIPFVNEFVSSNSQPSEPILRQLSLPTHQKLSVPSIPPSPTNSFHSSAKHHTVTYKPFPLFEFPCSQHVITQRTFQFPDSISVYSSSISGPRISPKPCPSTSKTTELPHHYHLPQPHTSLSWICVDLERMNHFRRSTILELLQRSICCPL